MTLSAALLYIFVAAPFIWNFCCCRLFCMKEDEAAAPKPGLRSERYSRARRRLSSLARYSSPTDGACREDLASTSERASTRTESEAFVASMRDIFPFSFGGA